MNEQIQKARDAALSVLKPSRKDLEHGLELHSNSLVCESYGFVPRSAPDGDAIAKALVEGASPGEFHDIYEDMMMTRCVEDPAERRELQEAWAAAGVDCIVLCAGEEGQAVARLLKRLARYTYMTDMMPEFLRRAVTPGDILAAREAGRHCVYLSCNGVPLPQEWNTVEQELRFIRVFFQLGCRMMHLTYNRRNMIGDGCGEPANAGLSDFGRAVVAEMNRVGVIVDVAHSGWRTSYEAAKASSYPMVASHSCCQALNDHIRAKPDEVIQAIVDTGGYIGICAIPNFLGRSGDIAAFLDHIEYVAGKWGPEHVAIGMDTSYLSRNWDREMGKFTRPKERVRWEALWPAGSEYVWKDFTPEKLQSLAWTNWPMFTVGLVQRGFSDEDIQKIIGGNVLRVAREVIKANPACRKGNG